MKLRFMAAVVGAALALPVAAQTPAGGADGTPITIASVSAITVNRSGTVTTAVKLREMPSTSAPIVEYWATTTQKEPELSLPVGITVLVVARTVDKEKVGDWNNYWYRVELSTGKQGRFQAWAYGEFIEIEAQAPFDGRPSLVFVEGGTFRMGDTAGGGGDNEKPVHQVTVSSVYLGKYEVTQKEWVAVMGSNPSNFKGGNLPVESLTWFEAVQFCNNLSAANGLDFCYVISGSDVSCDFSKNGYRLPTEAEWEYAAKGGKRSKGYRYAGGNDAAAVAWYSGNSGDTTHTVGGKQPNELGLYDMSGNVSEWCWDWYGRYSAATEVDPRGPSSGQARVVRGGPWDFTDVAWQRPSSRNPKEPQSRWGGGESGRGLRLARRS